MKNKFLLLGIALVLLFSCTFANQVEFSESVSSQGSRSGASALLNVNLTQINGSSGNYYFTDTSGSNNNLQYVGTTPVVATVNGKSGLLFNGNTLTNAGTNLNIGVEDFSISFSILTTQSSATILDKRGTGDNGYHITIYSGQILFQMNCETTYLNYYSTSATPINDGNWHDIKIEVDRNSTTGVKLYRDGVLQWAKNATYFLDKPLSTTGGTFYIGRHKNGTSLFNGYLSGFEIKTYPLPGVFVAVGYWRALKSEDNGVTWTQVGLNMQGLMGVAYGNGTFVAVGESGVILTSPNGTTWTQRLTTGDSFFSVTFGNGLFVAVGWEAQIFTSPDGITWTNRTQPGNPFNEVIYANNMFVAAGQDGRIMTSPNGITWTDRSVVGETILGLTYGNGLFVAVGLNGLIMTSPNTITWTDHTIPGWPLFGVAYGNGTFAAVGTYGRIMASTNGTTWTDETEAGDDFDAITFANGTFVTVGKYGRIMISTNGTTWTDKTVAGSYLRSVTSNF